MKDSGSISRITHAGVVFLGRKRPGFDEEWGAAMAERVTTALSARSWGVFFCPAKAVDDATLRKAVSECKASGCETLIALQTTMSDGRLAPLLAQLWNGPIVLWATPEKPEGDLVSSCSLVGTHLYASVFARMGVSFQVVSGGPEDDRLLNELDAAVRTTAAVGRLRQAKIGLAGYHAPGFINMHADPFAFGDALGAQLYHFGQQELLSAMEAIPENDLENDVEKTMQLGMPLVNVTEDELKVQSRYYLAIKRMIVDEHLEAFAVRCWPELPNLTGQWPYLAMVRLTDEGYAVTMEGDIDGAVGMLVLRLLGIEPGFLTDWLEHDDQHITVWHGGGTPASLAEPVGAAHERTIARHFNSDKAAVVDGWIAADRPVTLMRMWSDGRGYRLMTREGVTVTPTRHLRGTVGRVRIESVNVHDLFDQLCHEGMPHHLIVVPGHHGAILSRFGRLMGMGIV